MKVTVEKQEKKLTCDDLEDREFGRIIGHTLNVDKEYYGTILLKLGERCLVYESPIEYWESGMGFSNSDYYIEKVKLVDKEFVKIDSKKKEIYPRKVILEVETEEEMRVLRACFNLNWEEVIRNKKPKEELYKSKYMNVVDSTYIALDEELGGT